MSQGVDFSTISTNLSTFFTNRARAKRPRLDARLRLPVRAPNLVLMVEKVEILVEMVLKNAS